jgi:hypothetical protein
MPLITEIITCGGEKVFFVGSGALTYAHGNGAVYAPQIKRRHSYEQR